MNDYGLPDEILSGLTDPDDHLTSTDALWPRCTAECCQPKASLIRWPHLEDHNNSLNLGVSDLVPDERWREMGPLEMWRYLP